MAPGQVIGLTTGSEQEYQNSINSSGFSTNSVDSGPTKTGITLTGGVLYTIVASTSWVSTAPANSQMQLPLSSSTINSQVGNTSIYVINTGANQISLSTNAGDVGGTINGVASVLLGANTITEFACVAPGVFFSDGIGEGFSGSLVTSVSQGNVATAGSSSGTATPIVQTMVNFTSGGTSPAGGTLPPAKAGLQITVGVNNSTNTATIYANGSDTMVGASAGSSNTQAANSVIIYECFVNTVWNLK
jgi:hypothetical protein